MCCCYGCTAPFSSQIVPGVGYRTLMSSLYEGLLRRSKAASSIPQLHRCNT
jgi:hypothetical protein